MNVPRWIYLLSAFRLDEPSAWARLASTTKRTDNVRSSKISAIDGRGTHEGQIRLDVSSERSRKVPQLDKSAHECTESDAAARLRAAHVMQDGNRVAVDEPGLRSLGGVCEAKPLSSAAQDSGESSDSGHSTQTSQGAGRGWRSPGLSLSMSGSFNRGCVCAGWVVGDEFLPVVSVR